MVNFTISSEITIIFLFEILSRTIFICFFIRSLKRTAMDICAFHDQGDILCRHIYVTD